jgi:hypothetical protein
MEDGMERRRSHVERRVVEDGLGIGYSHMRRGREESHEGGRREKEEAAGMKGIAGSNTKGWWWWRISRRKEFAGTTSNSLLG